MSERLRICFLINDLGCGGAERQLVELVRRLSEEFEILLITVFDRGELKSEIQELNCQYSSMNLKLLNPLTILSGFFQLLKSFSQFKPNILHTWLFYSDISGRLAALFFPRLTVISSLRNTDNWRPFWVSIIDRLTARRCRLIISNTLAGAFRLQSIEKIPRNKLEVIHNGCYQAPITSTEIDLWNRRLKISNLKSRGHKIFALAGRLHYQKGFDRFLQNLIQAETLDSPFYSKCLFIIAGDGPRRQELEQLAAKLVHCKVILPGTIQPLTALFKNCDYFLLTSRYEGMPNVYLEAINSGLPSISTRLPVLNELMGNNILPELDLSSPQKFDRTLKLFLDQSKDIQNYCHQKIQKYSLEKTAQRYQKIYTKLLS